MGRWSGGSRLGCKVNKAQSQEVVPVCMRVPVCVRACVHAGNHNLVLPQVQNSRGAAVGDRTKLDTWP